MLLSKHSLRRGPRYLILSWQSFDGGVPWHFQSKFATYSKGSDHSISVKPGFNFA